MKPTTWNNIKIGDTIYIDNYQNGQFPKADPQISGPFKVVKGNGCGRCLQTMRKDWKQQRTFMHYPNNLLIKNVNCSI